MAGTGWDGFGTEHGGWRRGRGRAGLSASDVFYRVHVLLGVFWGIEFGKVSWSLVDKTIV